MTSTPYLSLVTCHILTLPNIKGRGKSNISRENHTIKSHKAATNLTRSTKTTLRDETKHIC